MRILNKRYQIADRKRRSKEAIVARWRYVNLLCVLLVWVLARPDEPEAATWEIESGSVGNECILSLRNSSAHPVREVTVKLEKLPDWTCFETREVKVADILAPEAERNAEFVFDVREGIPLGTEGTLVLLVEGVEGSWRKKITLSLVPQTPIPKVTALGQNQPNPFRASTVISYQISAPMQVTLKVYDLAGSLIRTLATEMKPAGFYEMEWQGKDDALQIVPDGIYFYRLMAGDFTATKKMVVLR